MARAWHNIEMLECVCLKRSAPLHTIWSICLALALKQRVYDQPVRPRVTWCKATVRTLYGEASFP